MQCSQGTPTMVRWHGAELPVARVYPALGGMACSSCEVIASNLSRSYTSAAACAAPFRSVCRNPLAETQHGAAGLNGGIMLFRNTDWSREYLDSVAHYGQFPPNMTTEQVQPPGTCSAATGLHARSVMHNSSSESAQPPSLTHHARSMQARAHACLHLGMSGRLISTHMHAPWRLAHMRACPTACLQGS